MTEKKIYKKRSRKWVGGRPTKMTLETIKKLEEAFSLDCTVDEACFYAWISHVTYHAFINKNKEYLNRFKALKNRPVLLARQSVVKNMQADWNLALKYLERKRKDEFSPRQEVTWEDGWPVQVAQLTEKQQEALQALRDARQSSNG